MFWRRWRQGQGPGRGKPSPFPFQIETPFDDNDMCLYLIIIIISSPSSPLLSHLTSHSHSSHLSLHTNSLLTFFPFLAPLPTFLPSQYPAEKEKLQQSSSVKQWLENGFCSNDRHSKQIEKAFIKGVIMINGNGKWRGKQAAPSDINPGRQAASHQD